MTYRRQPGHIHYMFFQCHNWSTFGQYLSDLVGREGTIQGACPIMPLLHPQPRIPHQILHTATTVRTAHPSPPPTHHRPDARVQVSSPCIPSLSTLVAHPSAGQSHPTLLLPFLLHGNTVRSFESPPVALAC